MSDDIAVIDTNGMILVKFSSVNCGRLTILAMDLSKKNVHCHHFPLLFVLVELLFMDGFAAITVMSFF